MATPAERKLIGANAYLAKHSIHRLFETVTAELVRLAPTNPLPYIAERVQQLRTESLLEVERPRVVAVVGGPASGKSTICAYLAQETGAIVLSPGELLRAEVREGTDVGREVALLLSENKQVPTSIVCDLIKKHIFASDKNSNNSNHDPSSPSTASSLRHRVFALDGFPSSLEQVLYLHEHVAEVSLVLFLEADDATLRQRMENRYKHTGIEDDQEPTRTKKIEQFHWETVPVKSYYDALGRMSVVVADGDVPSVCRGAEAVVRNA